MLIEVAINVSNLPPLVYKVPKIWQDQVAVGKIVLVPLRSRHQVGFIWSITDSAPGIKQPLKEIYSIARLSYQLVDYQLTLSKYLADYYVCSIGEVLDSCLPGLLLPSKNAFSVKPSAVLMHEQENLLLATFSQPDIQVINQSALANSDNKLAKLIYSLGKQQLPWQVTNNFSSRMLRSALDKNLVQLVAPAADSRQLFMKEPNAKYMNQHINNDHLDLARALNLAVKDSLPNNQHELAAEPAFSFNDQQQKAWQLIEADLLAAAKNKKPLLVHGITASGKTALYQKAAAVTLQHKKNVLILLPEIALTPQTKERFNKQLPQEVSLSHSKMVATHRLQTWFDAYYQRSNLIIGTRSAIFNPLANLGLLVVDEEHDSSYKQATKPCYNARDMAVVIAKNQQASIILGSATPSLESSHNARCGRYQLISMTKRATASLLPKLQLEDLSAVSRHKSMFYFSENTFLQLQKHLQNDQQCLIFINRRGYFNLLICKDCGCLQCCPNCSVLLNWHLFDKQWHCHSCFYKVDNPQSCMECQGRHLRSAGFGTEKIAADLQNYFKDKKVVIIDADFIGSVEQLSNTLQDIAAKKFDIIIGTQMLIKGHDFPKIDLVIVPLADMALNIDDFRSSERTFQQLAQVSGRAGRSQGQQAKAIIQCYNVQHPAICAAIDNDYQKFYNYAWPLRQKLNLPPAVRAVMIEISSLNEQHVTATANKLHQLLSAKASFFNVSGPTPSSFYKRSNRYHYQILITSKRITATKELLKKLIWHDSAYRFKNIRILINVDP